MRTGNPVLNQAAFDRGSAGTATAGQAPPVPGLGSGGAPVRPLTDRMTVEGTVYKTAFLLVLCLGAAAFAWRLAEQGILLIPGIGLTFIVLLGIAMLTAFKPHWAIVTGPLYAVVSGVVLGAVSALFNAAYDGIVAQAVIGTIGTAGGVLVAYRVGIIRVTPRFRKVVVGATIGIMLLYAISIGLRWFGLDMPLLHDTGPLGIGISLVIIGVAAMNLALDFDFIEKASNAGVPARMEWYGAFGILVTLVWLYIEILRLLAKLRD